MAAARRDRVPPGDYDQAAADLKKSRSLDDDLVTTTDAGADVPGGGQDERLSASCKAFSIGREPRWKLGSFWRPST